MNNLNKQCPIVLLENSLIYVTDQPNYKSLLKYLTDQGFEEQLELIEGVVDVVEEQYDSVSYWATPTLEQWLEDGDS